MKKVFKKRTKQQPDTPGRITNETVSEHRERILAGGRRFKYPIQYARHKLVINAVIVSVVTLIIIVVVGWWQLYQAQTTNTFFYRVTKVLPLGVASVDGETVRYSDYLMRYRSQEHYQRSTPSQIDLDSKDGTRLLNSYKREVLNQVEADTYATKLADERGITVTEEEINQVVNRSLQTANGRISQQLYDASTLDTLGYSPDEYRLIIRQSLTRQKVAYAIDEKAKQQQDAVQQLLKDAKKVDFEAIAKKIGGTDGQMLTVGASGLVRKNNQDGGLTAAALKLKTGEVSSAIKSTNGDGYYFVRLVETAPTQLSYEYIKIPLTEFRDKMSELRKAGKITEYISIPDSQTQLQNQ